MAALNFPASPTLNEIFVDGPAWKWDGVKWLAWLSILTPMPGFGSVVYVIPLTGATITAVPGQGGFQVNPAGAIAALTVVLPEGTVEGQVFETSTSQDITAVTVTAAAGDLIFGTQGTLGTLGAGGGFSFRFRLSNSTWYRIY